MMIAGLVLAGGRSTRFGAEKAAAMLNGQPLLQIAAAVLSPGCESVAVSAPESGEAARLAARLGLERLTDDAALPPGPLAGLLAGLVWAGRLGADLLATVPCDTPFLPADLVARLAAEIDEARPAAVARTADGLHPLCGVWRTGLAPRLAAALAGGRHPPVREVLAALPAREVWFPDARAFANLNTRADLDALSASPHRRGGGDIVP